MQRALEKQGYRYSSEFSLDYDNFPFFPILDGRFSSVLQIPIHPVCLGSFLATTDVKVDSPVVKNYFEKVLEWKYAQGEPMILYGHPTGTLGKWPAVMLNIIKKADKFDDIWNTTLTHFSEWWIERDRVQFNALIDHNDFSRLLIQPVGDSFKKRLSFTVIAPDRKEALLRPPPEGMEIILKKLKFEKIQEGSDVCNIGKPVNCTFKISFSYLRRKYIECFLWGLSRLDWFQRSVRFALDIYRGSNSK